MRRKSERTTTKKTKPSPEKKLEKLKRTRTRRSKKQSTSSENESVDESTPVREVEVVVEAEKKPPQTPVKEDSPDTEQDQVWQVKATEGSGDVGEIKKLKICLTRPPSTPERVDRSPRSKRKHSRATSSSDTPSVEAVEDRKKTRHRSKHATRESKDDSDKNQDSQEDEPEVDARVMSASEKSDNEISQSTETQKDTVSDETPMSTTNEDTKTEDNVEYATSGESTQIAESTQVAESSQMKESNTENKLSDADTTVSSPKAEIQDSQSEINTSEKDNPVNEEKTSAKESPVHKSSTSSEKDSPVCKDRVSLEKDCSVCEKSVSSEEDSPEHKKSLSSEIDRSAHKKRLFTEEEGPERKRGVSSEKDSPERQRSVSVEKSEVLEIHIEENKCESSESQPSKPQVDCKDEISDKSGAIAPASNDDDVSITIEEKKDNKVSKETESENVKTTNETDVVESTNHAEKRRNKNISADLDKAKDVDRSKDRYRTRDLERSDSVQSTQDEPVQNGEVTAAPIVVIRKRKWGSRPKITSQKSLTISTDVLKEIIPDVKPVEFNEVIEEKKQHKRVEVTEKLERPVLPKIVIDNTENVEQHRKELEDVKDVVKINHLAMNRRISIVKDNDSIIARPPSPPRHKQSNILYITNLVRPFTLPQLKNLLQRTGRIVDNGFWIDRIKSKCYIKYETEDQAVETRHALHGVTWPVSNPKALQVDFSTQEAFDHAKLNEDTDNAQTSTIPGTVEDWLREQDLKRERGELDNKPWERKAAMREWDVGKNEKEKEKEKLGARREDRPQEKRRHHTPERSPEPARKFKKKEEEAPAKLLDDLFRKTKTTPCIYWLPLSAETIAVKEEQRRQHMAEHERRLLELRRTHRRH